MAIIIATVALGLAIILIVYQVSWFISFTNDIITNFMIGAVRIISILSVVSLLWMRRPGIYILSSVISVGIASIFLSAFSGTINIADALTIGALFLAVVYYKGFLNKQTDV